MHDLTSAVAPAARDGGRAGLGARTVTRLALRLGGQLDLLLAAEHRFVEVDADDVIDVRAASGAAAGARASAPEHPAEQVAEYVRKIAAEIARIEVEAAEPGAAAPAAGRVMPERVVLLALLRVAQHAVSLAGFLELRLGFLVPRVKVGVIFLREVAVRLFQRRIVRRFGYAQDLVIISLFFVCHTYLYPFCLYTIPIPSKKVKQISSHFAEVLISDREKDRAHARSFPYAPRRRRSFSCARHASRPFFL